jgi:hypothetical protein
LGALKALHSQRYSNWSGLAIHVLNDLTKTAGPEFEEAGPLRRGDTYLQTGVAGSASPG